MIRRLYNRFIFALAFFKIAWRNECNEDKIIQEMMQELVNDSPRAVNLLWIAGLYENSQHVAESIDINGKITLEFWRNV